MGRSRVLSFMSAFGAPKSPTTSSFSGPQHSPTAATGQFNSSQEVVTSSSPTHGAAPSRDSPPPRTRTERASSIRPMSMVQTYQPPLMEIAQDTIPELQPIFSFLNSHANKLYQEGYFLKLNDLDTHGRPNADRSWTESFAQLVGTILSLWDASALDAAGQDGEVAPTFINLADASIKMIETLPTRSSDVQPLQNVLSISTAGKNRYLFHFNSLHSLTQWTAAIRLAMFENATLQEAYTGSLIAGKGKLLNNIKVIMDRTRIVNEDWTRVRFGAGTPWRRCWCVITPPSEKDVQKQQKQLKKKSAYERTPALKGRIQFYDTRKTKKARPIATINDAYSAYAIYPQSKPLIDQSTLIKVEGSITIHSSPETVTEGFVFVMPEVHPAVTGFEMMLRFIFPLYDVFALYGRPSRLVADTLDTRSLMFALPQERRYGYLEILDVAGLIHEVGSQSWSEREWRKRMKDLTSHRMTRMTTNGRPRSRASSYRGYRNSVASRGGTLRYEDGASVKSTPSLHRTLEEVAPMPPPHRSDTAPPTAEGGPFTPPPQRPRAQHQRSFSEASQISIPRHQRSQRNGQNQEYTPSRLSYEQSPARQIYNDHPLPAAPYDQGAPAPPPPTHGVPAMAAVMNPQKYGDFIQEPDTPTRSSSESERRFGVLNSTDNLNGESPPDFRQDMAPAPPPEVVMPPPAFSHEPGAQPRKRPGISPDLRRENSRLSVTTLSQLTDASKNSSGGAAAAGAAAAWRSNSQSGRSNSGGPRQGYHAEEQQRGVNVAASRSRNIADRSNSAEGMVLAPARNLNPRGEDSRNVSATSSQQDTLQPAPYYKDKTLMTEYDLLTPGATPGATPKGSGSRNVSPLSQTSTPPDSDPISGVPSQTTRQVSSSPSRIAALDKPLPTPLKEQPQRPGASRSNTSHSIGRKPVPTRAPGPPSPSRSQPPPPPERIPDPPPPEQISGLPDSAPDSRFNSLHDQYIDEEALAQVLDQSHAQSLTNASQYTQDAESLYDNDSTVSPDYASTAPRKSAETSHSRPSIEKPRRGVLKTVGKVEPVPQEPVQVGDVQYRPGMTPEPVISTDIPTVDFGPTQAYDPAKVDRPTTSDTMTNALQRAPQSPERATPSPGADSLSRNHGPATMIPSGKRVDAVERSPSRNLTTPEPQIRAPSAGVDNDNRRSIAWQPGAAFGAASPGSRQSITPEQFVAQRAAASRVTPIYAHARQGSGSPTPPNVTRQSSGELPIQKQRMSMSPASAQKRQSSYGNDLPRPSSRATSTMLNGSDDYAAHLSAREQEHVARVTGSPLVNMVGKANQNPAPGSGLIGAIEAREKEKKELKQGMGGQMVQHAIAQRQHHGQAHQARQSSYSSIPAQQYAAPSPQYAMPGTFPPSPNQYTSFPATAASQQPYAFAVQQPHLQQQYAQYQQQQQQQLQYQQHPPQPQAWKPPGAGQIYGGAQPYSPYAQQPSQQPQFHQQNQQGYYGSSPSQQNPGGPYYGTGQGGGSR